MIIRNLTTLAIICTASAGAMAQPGSSPAPVHNSGNVLSLYSDAFPSRSPGLFVGYWNQSTTGTPVMCGDNEALRFDKFDYVGLQVSDNNDIVNMAEATHVHLDLYAPEPMSVNFYPISLYPTVDSDFVNCPLEAGRWVSFDLPLSRFPNVDFSNFGQVKFDGGDATKTFYLDNLYFYNSSSPVTPPNPFIPDSGNQNGSGEKDGYRLVWQDLFDASSLDRLNWDIEVNGNGGGNNELQYYTDKADNVRVGDDGNGNQCLILTAKREYYKGKGITSGRINSKNRVTFTHGKMEASIKLPKTANGLWPAFWMMGNDFDQVGWPKCGETDILEMGHQNAFASGTQERYFNGASHWGPGWPQSSADRSLNAKYSLQDGEFHLFTIIWDEEGYKMYYDLDRDPDARPYYTLKCPVNDVNNDRDPGNYFHKPNFIIFNLAVGGGFPGIYDPKEITALNEDNGNQASMYVNYVKIYQKGAPDETLSYKGSTSIENLASDTSGEGRITVGEFHISAPGELSLWSLDGILKARSAEGQISSQELPSGIYIARCGTETLKIKIY